VQIFARRACGYVFGTISNAMLYSGCRRSGFGFPGEDARRDGAFPPETFTIRTLSEACYNQEGAGATSGKRLKISSMSLKKQLAPEIVLEFLKIQLLLTYVTTSLVG